MLYSCRKCPNAYYSLLNHCIHLYESDHAYQRTITNIYILGVFAPTVFKIAPRRSRCRCHVLREVLVVVLVTSSAFSQTKCRSNEADFVPLHWRRRWQDYYTSRSTLSSVTRAGAWGEGRSPSVVTRPLGGSVFLPNRCAPAGCSLSVAAPACLTLWRTPAGSARRTRSNSAADPEARGGGPASCSSR